MIRVGHEAGVREEVAGRPLPHVADHLPAPEAAVAGGVGGHVHTPEGAAVASDSADRFYRWSMQACVVVVPLDAVSFAPAGESAAQCGTEAPAT